jgi:hypothetical protein
MEEVIKYGGEGQGLIDVAKDPERVLVEAKRAAEALVRVVSAKPKKVVINDEQYLEFEDWQTLGRFYGLTVRVDSTEPVNFDGVKGWQARASILNRAGEVISSADAMCLNDEEKWSSRSKYEYLYILKDGSKSADNPPKDQIVWIDNPNKAGKKMPKKERVKMPDVAVPFFQLRSMAQTRASAKAFRNVLAWVVVLAGYKPTPAEEMSGVGEGEFEEMPEKKEDPPNGHKFINTQVLNVTQNKTTGEFKVFILLNGNEVGLKTKSPETANAAKKEIGGIPQRIEYDENYNIVSMSIVEPKQ